MNYILQTKNICKNYGRTQVLRDLNMNIPRNSIYGFVCKNGAGKQRLSDRSAVFKSRPLEAMNFSAFQMKARTL